jgi:hypothetical protein
MDDAPEQGTEPVVVLNNQNPALHRENELYADSRRTQVPRLTPDTAGDERTLIPGGG